MTTKSPNGYRRGKHYTHVQQIYLGNQTFSLKHSMVNNILPALWLWHIMYSMYFSFLKRPFSIWLPLVSHSPISDLPELFTFYIFICSFNQTTVISDTYLCTSFVKVLQHKYLRYIIIVIKCDMINTCSRIGVHTGTLVSQMTQCDNKCHQKYQRNYNTKIHWWYTLPPTGEGYFFIWT